VPDKQTHRGAHPSDAKLFAPAMIGRLKAAVADFSLLLSKGYAEKSALKLVGDRFSLTGRQRLAVMRSACSEQQRTSRRQREVPIVQLSGQPIVIDGYNVLITVEAAISNGLILLGVDGCYKDLASIHGTYRKVAETTPALERIGSFLKEINVKRALWLLDSPVSNSNRLKKLISGRLKKLMAQLADKNDYRWDIELVLSPDAGLVQTDDIGATSDSVILDKCARWVNLAAEIVKAKVPGAAVVDMACSYRPIV